MKALAAVVGAMTAVAAGVVVTAVGAGSTTAAPRSAASPSVSVAPLSTIFTTIALIALNARRVESAATASGNLKDGAGAVGEDDERRKLADASLLLLAKMLPPARTSTTTITTPPATTAASCVHMNDVLWEIQRDATTRPFVQALFAVFYSLIIVFGVLGNLCVVLSISRTKSLQTVPNIFIFSLSCSDIVVCCTSATITPITAFKKEWLFGSFLCSVAPFIAGVSLCFSTFTLAAISLDRFMLIRFPMKKPFSHTLAFLIICVACLLAAALSLPIVFMQRLRPINKYCGAFCYEDWGERQSERRIYGTLMLALQFIIPLGVIVFCYTAISVRLGQTMLLKSKHGGAYQWQLQMTEQQRAATKRRQRTNRMFIAMVVAFSASWVWTLMFNVARDYDVLPAFVKRQEFFFGIITHCIAMTSTVWNPLLYALLNLQLRAAFLQLMPRAVRALVTKASDAGSAAAAATTRVNAGAKTLSPNRTPLVGDSTRLLLLAQRHGDALAINGVVADCTLLNGNRFVAARRCARAASSDSSTPASSSDASLDSLRDRRGFGCDALLPATAAATALYEQETTISAHTAERTDEEEDYRIRQLGGDRRGDYEVVPSHTAQPSDSSGTAIAKYGSFDVTLIPSLVAERGGISDYGSGHATDLKALRGGTVISPAAVAGGESIELGSAASEEPASGAQRKRPTHELGGGAGSGGGGRSGGGRAVQRVANAWRTLVWRRRADDDGVAAAALRPHRGGDGSGDGVAGAPGTVAAAVVIADVSAHCQLGTRVSDQRRSRATLKKSSSQRHGDAAGRATARRRQRRESPVAGSNQDDRGIARRASISPLLADGAAGGTQRTLPSLSFDASPNSPDSGRDGFGGAGRLPAYRGSYREVRPAAACADASNAQRRQIVDECLVAAAAVAHDAERRNRRVRSHSRSPETSRRPAAAASRLYYCPECRHNATAVCELYGCECCAPSADAGGGSAEDFGRLNTLRATLSQPQTPRARTPQSPRAAITATIKSVRSTPSVARKSLSFRTSIAPSRVRNFVNRLSLVALSGGDASEMLFGGSGPMPLTNLGNDFNAANSRRRDNAEQIRPLIGNSDESTPTD